MARESKSRMCPFLEEMLMQYCRAYPVRKLVPKHRISSRSLCADEGHERCPFFNEIMAQCLPPAAISESPVGGGHGRKEVKPR